MDSARYGNVIAHPRVPFEGCTISKKDWELVRRGHQVEKERSYRNLFLGITISSGFGTLSTVLSHFEQLFSTGMPPLESTFLVLMISASLAAGALTAFFNHRIKQDEPSRELQLLNETIQFRLEHPEDPNDPRQWP